MLNSLENTALLKSEITEISEEQQALYDYCCEKTEGKDGYQKKGINRTLGRDLNTNSVTILSKDKKEVISFSAWKQAKNSNHSDDATNEEVVDYLLQICHYSPAEIKLIYDNYSQEKNFVLGNILLLELRLASIENISFK